MHQTSYNCTNSRFKFVGEAAHTLRYSRGDGSVDIPICGGTAMGHALLLQRRPVVELVLRLPLRSSHFWFV
jgi:hypothetical protein